VTGAVASAAVLVGMDRTGGTADDHGPAGHDVAAGGAHTAAPAVVTVSEPVAFGTGTARLEVDAARRDDGDEVLTGRPVTLRVRLDGVDGLDGTAPLALEAERTGRGSTEAEAVSLERAASVAIDRATGELYLLAGSAGHDDHAGHGGSSSGSSGSAGGAGLAAVAGSAAEWAARVVPGSAPQAGGDGRWIVAAHDGHPMLDVVDTLLHTVRAAPLPAPAVAVAFQAGTDRWWTVDAAGGLTVVDPMTAAATPVGHVGIGTAAPVTLVAAPGAGPLYVARPSGDAAVVPTTGTGPVAAVEAPTVVPGGALSHVAWSAALDAFVGVAPDGAIVAVNASGTRRLAPAGPAGTTMLALHPSGLRAVAVRGTTAEVVDLTDGEIVGRAATGPDPRQVVVLDRFAVVRDGRDASLMWVDLDQPERSAELPLGTDGPPSALTVSADGTELSVAVPSQRKVLRADVMMGRPMIMASEPTGLNADLVLRSRTRLVATAPGTWQLTTVLPLEGTYRLRLRGATAEASFTIEAAADGTPTRVMDEPLRLATDVERSVTLRFTYDGAAPDRLDLVAYAEASAVQQRLVATRVGSGDGPATYSTAFTPTVAGVHQVFVTPTDGAPITDSLVASVTVTGGR
jgi:hypothetical protein